jgi:hypothetical protein
MGRSSPCALPLFLTPAKWSLSQPLLIEWTFCGRLTIANSPALLSRSEHCHLIIIANIVSDHVDQLLYRD